MKRVAPSRAGCTSTTEIPPSDSSDTPTATVTETATVAETETETTWTSNLGIDTRWVDKDTKTLSLFIATVREERQRLATTSPLSNVTHTFGVVEGRESCGEINVPTVFPHLAGDPPFLWRVSVLVKSPRPKKAFQYWLVAASIPPALAKVVAKSHPGHGFINPTYDLWNRLLVLLYFRFSNCLELRDHSVVVVRKKERKRHVTWEALAANYRNTEDSKPLIVAMLLSAIISQPVHPSADDIALIDLQLDDIFNKCRKVKTYADRASFSFDYLLTAAYSANGWTNFAEDSVRAGEGTFLIETAETVEEALRSSPPPETPPQTDYQSINRGHTDASFSSNAPGGDTSTPASSPFSSFSSSPDSPYHIWGYFAQTSPEATKENTLTLSSSVSSSCSAFSTTLDCVSGGLQEAQFEEFCNNRIKSTDYPLSAAGWNEDPFMNLLVSDEDPEQQSSSHSDTTATVKKRPKSRKSTRSQPTRRRRPRKCTKTAESEYPHSSCEPSFV